MIFLTETERNSLLERFLNYVSVWTTSDSQNADNNIQPSTDRQFDLARLLENELKDAGFSEVQVTEKCYVYAKLPSNAGAEAFKYNDFCLLAHMDTVEECSGKDIKTILTQKNDDTIISTDGSTLLGADDKAGIAEIMTALTYLVSHPELKHGNIELCFSPDEETGHGMDNVPLNLIKSKQAYTVDGGNLGELETECFNAYKSEVTFTGKSTHTGTARQEGMVNANLMASAFVCALPRHQAPETTDNYQGFYAVMDVSGSIESSKVTVFLRDFSSEEMKNRINLIDATASSVALNFGGTAKTVHTEQYKNMKDELEKSPSTVQNLIKAYKAAGVEPVFVPIRGGTDGSRLTEMGIPAPNIFTGGHNFHSRNEWASLNEMEKVVEILIYLSTQQKCQ